MSEVKELDRVLPVAVGERVKMKDVYLRPIEGEIISILDNSFVVLGDDSERYVVSLRQVMKLPETFTTSHRKPEFFVPAKKKKKVR